MGAGLDPVRGLTVVEIMNAVHAGEITACMSRGKIPRCRILICSMRAGHWPCLSTSCARLFVTETAFHADVILPASAFAEKSGSFTNTDRRVQLAREVIKPPGDARQDLWIIQEIGKRMGLPWNYSGPGEVFTEMAQLMPSLNNITWERLLREGAVTYPVDGPDQPGNEIIFTTGFPTESGRGKIVPAHVLPPDEVARRRISDGALHRPCTRTLAHRLDDPSLQCARPDRAGGGRLYVAKGYAAAESLARRFHPARTRRGAVELKVRSDRDVPENMVFMPFCYAEAAANLLTNPALDPFGKIPEFKFCAVRAERAELRNAAE